MSTQPTNNRIKVANPPLEDKPTAYLSLDYNSGVSSFVVTSVAGFPGTSADDFYVLIGNYGDEKAEIVLVDASATVSSTNTFTTIGATKNSHEASDPVILIDYNEIALYSLPSLTSNIYTLIKTVDIDPTSHFTEVIYAEASPTAYFFATAYHKDGTSGQDSYDTISGYSETISTLSFTRRSVERIIRAGARKAMTKIDENPNSTLNWDVALEVLQDGIDEISARKKRWPFWQTTATTATTIGGAYISKPTDMTQLHFIKVDGYTLEWVSNLDYARYQDGATSSQYGKPSAFTIKNNQIYFTPVPDNVYTVDIEYYKTPDVISNMSTEVAIPLTVMLVYYCGSQFADIRGNSKKADALYAKFQRLLEDQVVEYSDPIQDGFPEYVESTTSLSDDSIWGPDTSLLTY